MVWGACLDASLSDLRCSSRGRRPSSPGVRPSIPSRVLPTILRPRWAPLYRRQVDVGALPTNPIEWVGSPPLPSLGREAALGGSRILSGSGLNPYQKGEANSGDHPDRRKGSPSVTGAARGGRFRARREPRVPLPETQTGSQADTRERLATLQSPLPPIHGLRISARRKSKK